jgi:hypothetical protein
MRPLLKQIYKIILTLNLLLMLIGPVYSASINSGYPGYPGVWSGLTTNTIMVIDLDAPVAMNGTQPDMTYCVKKLSGFNGFDYVFTDVTCDAATADDRMSVTLYPQALLDTTSQYAYHVVSINFQGGGSAQNFSQCYLTGNNPVIWPASSVNEVDLCNDYNNPDGYNQLSGGNYCFRCHVNEYTKVGSWPVGNFPPAPTCTP